MITACLLQALSVAVWEERMSISKTVLWLSVIDALLVLLASASGILLTSIYARETPIGADFRKKGGKSDERGLV